MVFSLFKNLGRDSLPEKDRRNAPRVARQFIAQCEIGGKKSFSTIVNISHTGLGVYLERPVDKGTTLTITLQYEFVNGAYDSKQVNLALPARIIWLVEDDSGGSAAEARDKKFRAGVELEPLSPETEQRYRLLCGEA